MSSLCVAHNTTVNTCLLEQHKTNVPRTWYLLLCAPHSAPLLEVLLLAGNLCFTAKASSSFSLICFAYCKNWKSGVKNSNAVPRMCSLTFLLVTSKAISFSACITCINKTADGPLKQLSCYQLAVGSGLDHLWERYQCPMGFFVFTQRF